MLNINWPWFSNFHTGLRSRQEHPGPSHSSTWIPVEVDDNGDDDDDDDEDDGDDDDDVPYTGCCSPSDADQLV